MTDWWIPMYLADVSIRFAWLPIRVRTSFVIAEALLSFVGFSWSDSLIDRRCLPSSTAFASMTSSWAVSNATRPISLRYMRTVSSVSSEPNSLTHCSGAMSSERRFSQRSSSESMFLFKEGSANRVSSWTPSSYDGTTDLDVKACRLTRSPVGSLSSSSSGITDWIVNYWSSLTHLLWEQALRVCRLVLY